MSAIDDLPIKVRVIPPLTITDAILTSTNAPYPGAGETLWVAGTYAAGAKVVYIKRKWISLQASNTKTPGAADADDWWDDNGPANAYAMFDLTTNERTVLASPLTVVLTPGRRITSIALSGLVGNGVSIKQTVSAVEKYNAVIDLNTRVVLNYTDFFFQPFSTKSAVARFNIPPFTNGVITITITATSGNVECGALVIGSDELIGVCEARPRVTGLNFSTITRDFAANINNLVQRRSVPKVTARVLVDKARVSRVLRLKDDLNAEPAFYAFVDDDSDGYFEALQGVAIYKVFEFSLDDPSPELALLELETEAI